MAAFESGQAGLESALEDGSGPSPPGSLPPWGEAPALHRENHVRGADLGDHRCHGDGSSRHKGVSLPTGAPSVAFIDGSFQRCVKVGVNKLRKNYQPLQ
ncbi:hypothetical protein chiPu_0019334 [Chiloscyllium punctatum]|uniref:Uncharacterized protein n=1 Tax=Chiloscyllium punctatum TaxID=137246 RepID=A0A401RRK6_CHIPU|nr:hypothetical protein [Chiloscyllium punctatum]